MAYGPALKFENIGQSFMLHSKHLKKPFLIKLLVPSQTCARDMRELNPNEHYASKIHYRESLVERKKSTSIVAEISNSYKVG